MQDSFYKNSVYCLRIVSLTCYWLRIISRFVWFELVHDTRNTDVHTNVLSCSTSHWSRLQPVDVTQDRPSSALGRWMLQSGFRMYNNFTQNTVNLVVYYNCFFKLCGKLFHYHAPVLTSYCATSLLAYFVV